ncbi:hypothetical protein EHI8A_052640 [Entamoeba histolytica HM-1:IMSS-B]|uniref:DC2 protein n=6 Tax=Entamoeba histolytica TaxID=5759 RepID=C4LWC8_ENTH1|nr:hypothetical protein, conserved [Entamoeba histolytica HM-1:IMSS]EMD44595.1 DC2 protein [Entamoeba histolytica KU27]EMH74185.1 hypothetical protein EHI8A_052640 [Entamoeba histolytica HM-1:IMSS-B]EMS12668.1 DC2 protein [Entamoeba histolytica HM-3:IMSS]ENY64365.1 DC2 protein, putative [Entamoeba histolytica HM-1:IMSS-A]GAT93012.1 hypothetical protein conserved [Entamoeba histolytica]|eukprot:XP_656989.1 hypothetical protein, conserved [Entamoeba histolytica HM-1:IMSS]
MASTITRFFQKNIFSFILVSYAIIMAGIFYDIIIEPPGTGSVIDKYGNIKPETIMKGRHNGQYVVEGICASIFFVMIAGGMVIVDKSISMTEADRKKPLFAVGGVVATSFGLLMIYFFAKTKFGF